VRKEISDAGRLLTDHRCGLSVFSVPLIPNTLAATVFRNRAPQVGEKGGGRGGEGGDEPRAGEGADLASLKRLIIERTQGTPFFMEEMVQALFDEGALTRNGTTHLTRPLAELKIPPTVQGILAARIDRLPPDAKELLQTLACSDANFRSRWCAA
jgi:hypothetical protein